MYNYQTLIRILKQYKFQIGIILSIIIICIIVYIYKHNINYSTNYILSPPSLHNWFGTDIIGGDIFLESTNALLVAIITLGIVLPVIYIGGVLFGFILSYFNSPKLREFFLNLVHYWLTVPILLIAIFLLILIGAGQGNVIGILIFVLIPSQSLYVYNQLEEAKKQDFVIAKRSYGFSKNNILSHHVFPYIRNSYNTYTLSRMPELLMMDLAFNYLGLGVQPPNSSFGKMLFDGLSFMFSAWWIWIFPVIFIIFLFILANSVLTNVSKKYRSANG